LSTYLFLVDYIGCMCVGVVLFILLIIYIFLIGYYGDYIAIWFIGVFFISWILVLLLRKRLLS